MAKVLVVEDSLVQALVLQQMLEHHGLDVRHAPDGQTGLDMARHWLPDAVVLDVKMPRLDGFEVCRRLQEDNRTSHIPIIMLTRYADHPALRQSIYLGAVEFIPKDDFANTVLLEVLRQLQVLTKFQGEE